MAANIDTTGEPRLHGKIPKSTVVQVGNHSVGIIGYLTIETSVKRICPWKLIRKVGREPNVVFFLATRQLQYISSPDGIRIFDEIQGIREEAERLKKEGVNILIAVGHAGYLKDMEIAEQVPDIDVVVGGHTNTFLWNGNISIPKITVISYVAADFYSSRLSTIP